MKVVSLGDVKSVPVTMAGAANVCRQLPLGTADGTPSFSLRVFTIGPGGHTPWHEHGWEHLNYIIEGDGVLVDGDGNETPIRRGDFALVPPGEKHQYRNTAVSGNLVMICGVPKEYE